MLVDVGRELRGLAGERRGSLDHRPAHHARHRSPDRPVASPPCFAGFDPVLRCSRRARARARRVRWRRRQRHPRQEAGVDHRSGGHRGADEHHVVHRDGEARGHARSTSTTAARRRHAGARVRQPVALRPDRAHSKVPQVFLVKEQRDRRLGAGAAARAPERQHRVGEGRRRHAHTPTRTASASELGGPTPSR